MACKSNVFSDVVLNMLAVGTMPTTGDVQATIYEALLTTNPGAGKDICAAIVASYTNYTRPSIASSSVGRNASANGTTSRQITNKLALRFGAAGSDTATIIDIALCKHVPDGCAVTVASKII